MPKRIRDADGLTAQEAKFAVLLSQGATQADAFIKTWPKTRATKKSIDDRASHLAKPECDKFCKRGDTLHRQFKHRGYVKTLLGRRSRFPSNYKTYIGLNRVLQGTASDIMKRKLVELHRERKNTGFLMRMTVHDMVGGDAQEPETLARVSEILNQQSVTVKVPILWACKQGPNWADCQ